MLIVTVIYTKFVVPSNCLMFDSSSYISLTLLFFLCQLMSDITRNVLVSFENINKINNLYRIVHSFDMLSLATAETNHIIFWFTYRMVTQTSWISFLVSLRFSHKKYNSQENVINTFYDLCLYPQSRNSWCGRSRHTTFELLKYPVTGI